MATKTSSSSSSSLRKRYEVFLSFRGEDTRRSFTDHLYKALNDDKGIYTFRDDKKLERGKDVAPELLKAIEESRFAVVVFSKDYASSTWCLIELVKIVECKKNRDLTVLPIFYHVEPTDVRKQKGEFGEAFAKHVPASQEDIEKVNKWREALTEVASISGWHIKEKEGRPETEDLKEILQEILKKLNTVSLSNNDLVGMAYRLEKMYLLLKIDRLEEIRQLKDVCTVGIWGMRGIGKTTLAEEVRKKIADEFEACGFIGNVREEFKKHGIVYLQNCLYKFMLNDEGKIQNVEMGKDVLRNRLCSRRVLIILDDVDELEQIEDLVGNAEEQQEWLGPGSRVIVTTSNKHLLKTYGENNIYEDDKLNEDEALRLFSRKAFKECHPLDGFVDLSKSFVKYADGHPLALRVLGSFLYGREMDEWSETLQKVIRGDPEETIDKVLRVLEVSYNGLDGDKKEIFLDVACFFKGWNAFRVKKILERCGLHPTIDINVLIEKSLIYMVRNRLWMHDLLQQLGQRIVRQESQEPGKRSRIWSHEDACHVLAEKTGTEAVRGIFLSLPETEVLRLEDDSIFKMKRLRLLKFRNVLYPKRVEYLSNELRLLEWHGYPLTSMPPNFHPNNLVELNISSSRIERLWKTTHDLKWLISINLSNCEHLTQAPDFSRIPNLEMLILEGCKRLSVLDSSIGELKRLVLLNLKGCESLKSLSQYINLKSLETFILSGCKKLEKFPEVVEDMNHLSKLYLDGTAIKELPESIKHLTGLTLLDLTDCKMLLKLPDVLCNLTSLKALKMSGCSHLDQLPENIGSLEQVEELDARGTAIRKAPSSIILLKNLRRLSFAECSGLAYRSWKSMFGCFLLPTEEASSFQLPNTLSSGLISLTFLCLRKCNLTREAIPEDMYFPSLKHLDLSENNFKTLPKSISMQSNLRYLYLNNCRKLESLPKLPLSLKSVYANGCPMLNKSNDEMTIWTSDRGFCIIHCHKSVWSGHIHYHESENEALSIFGEHLEMLYTKDLKDDIINGGWPMQVGAVRGIPEWCSQQNDGSSIRIRLPPEDGDKTWIGFALFVIFVSKEGSNFQEDENTAKARCHFGTDEGCLCNEYVCLHLENGFGSYENGFRTYGVCIYIPRMGFEERLNKASLFSASISTNKPNLKAEQCGMHIIFNKDVPEFCRRLVHRMVNPLYLEGEELLTRKINLEPSSSALATEIQPNPHKLIKQEDCRSSDSGLPRKARKDLQWVVLMLAERFKARNCFFSFEFPEASCLKLGGWFFNQSMSPFVFCYIPKNILDDKACLGFCLYAQLARRPSALHNDNLDSDAILYISLQPPGAGQNRLRKKFGLFIKYELLMLNIPLVMMKPLLNQCQLVGVLFTPTTPEWEVKFCGARFLYEQDLGNVIETITDQTLLSQNQFHYEDKYVKDKYGEVQLGCPATMEVELPFDLHSSEREKKSLQELLSNSEDVDLSVLFKEYIGWIPSEAKYLRAGFTNLQIMAENALSVNDLRKWQEEIKFLVEHGFRFNIIVALILKGHILSVVKPFNPLASYNLNFPHKEILDWFGADCHVSRQYMNFEFPLNLNITDKDWRGLAVCAAFAVHEHPTIFLDGNGSKNFELQCHLHGEKYCLDPPPIVIAKDQTMWLYVRGFICLIYIPRFALTEMTVEQIRFTTQCPGVVTTKIGARLLYQQDVEDLKQSIVKATVSFFDNLDPIHKAVADHENIGNSCDCLSHSRLVCCMPMYEEISAYCGFEANKDENPSYAVKITETCEDDNSHVVTQQENLTEQIYQRKSEVDFDRGMIYSSCFPSTEILDWFNQQNGPSLTIQLPLNLCCDDNFIGLALCAYFSDPYHPTLSLGNFDSEIPHYLVCHLETERSGLYPLHHHGITNEELKKLDGNGELIWLSYVPHPWFSDQLKDCNLIKASFASDRRGWWAQKCGLRLIYRHDEEEFKQTINHCMLSLIDNQDPISHAKVDNERHKKQSHDDQAGSGKSSSFIPDPQQERPEGPKNLNPKDKGKRIPQ